MNKYACLNNISDYGLKRFSDNYRKIEDSTQADCLIVRSANMVDMDFSDNLLCIARAGVGVNNIPIDRASDAGIVVFNTPGGNSNAVKESVLAALLMAGRDLLSGIEWVRDNADKPDIKKLAEAEKKRFAGKELAGKSIGIIGLGAIGIKVANAAIALGMDVYGYDAYLSVKSAWELNHNVHRIDDINKLYEVSDFVTIHVPFVPSTEKMINAEAISKMKDGAVLLNFARDRLCDEEAVLEALDSGKLKYYLSDFPNSTVAGHPHCIVTPHLGASTKESEDNSAAMAVDNIIAYIENGSILHSVNFPSVNVGVCKAPCRVVILHKNIPNMVGQITKVIASIDANIENMVNNSKGDYAYSVLDISQQLSNDIVDRFNKIDGVLKIRTIVNGV